MKKAISSILALLTSGALFVPGAMADPVLAAHSDLQSAAAGSKAVPPIDKEAELLPVLPNNEEEASVPLVVPPIRTIVIDPGHGGTNEGAIGVAGIYEKNITLKIALILSDRLKKAFPDVKIILTRETDRYISLSDRIAIANDVNADLFLSLHLNSSTNPNAIGYESFWAGEFLEQESDKLGDSDDVREQKRRVAPYSQFLGECFNKSMSHQFDVLDRGVKPGDYTVLTRAKVPAVVFEFGFLSNADEGMALIKPEHQSKLVDALVNAVVKYSKGRS